MNNILKIAESLFDVQKVQLTTGIDGYNLPESFGMYRTTGGQCLGTVGNTYNPTQPAALFDNLIDCLDSQDVDLEKLTYTEMKGGSKIKFTTPFKSVSFKNIRGQEDESIISINLQTGYDGLTKTSLYLSMFRLICTNGMKANKTEFTTSFKNTTGNAGKIGNLCSDVAKSMSMYNDLESILKTLNGQPVNQKQVTEFLNTLTGIDITAPDTSTRSKNIYDQMLNSIEIEIQRTGASKWGLLNGITYYTNHVATAENREEYILLEKGMTLNNAAFELLTAN